MPRPRKPTAILDLTGRLKHDKKRYADRADEPKDARPLGDPPARLDPNQSAIWIELRDKLVPGVAVVGDEAVFEQMVELEDLRRRGKISAAERGILMKSFSWFGMAPSERSRVKAPRKDGDGGNPFANLGA